MQLRSSTTTQRRYPTSRTSSEKPTEYSFPYILANEKSAEHSSSCTLANTLPTELLLMMFKELHKKDLKSVRLVSAQWNDIATELLFDRIWISHRQKDIEVFNAWTANSKCSSFVKTLVYDASFLDPNMEVDEYVNYLCSQLEEIDPRGLDFRGCDPHVQEMFYYLWGGRKLNKREQKMTVDHLFKIGRFGRDRAHWLRINKAPGSRILDFPILQEGHAAYLAEALIEQEIREGGELLVHLTRGLERLPRLQHITYWEDSHLFGEHHTTPFNPLRPEPIYLSGPPFIRSWNPLYNLPNNRLNGQCADPCEYEPLISTQEALSYKFQTLVSAISLSRVRITELEIAGDQTHFEPLQKQLKRDSLLSRNLSTIFAHLESFSLSIMWSEFYVERGRFDGLQSALSVGVNLTHLDLKGHEYLHESALVAKCVFSSVLPCTVALTKLRTLKLDWFTFEVKNLISFLQRHRLDRLELHHVVIRVIGADPTVDARAVCSAVSAHSMFKLSNAETMAVHGFRGDPFLILSMDSLDPIPVAKLGIKSEVGLTKVGSIVDLNDTWDNIQGGVSEVSFLEPWEGQD